MVVGEDTGKKKMLSGGDVVPEKKKSRDFYFLFG